MKKIKKTYLNIINNNTFKSVCDDALDTGDEEEDSKVEGSSQGHSQSDDSKLVKRFAV